MQKKQEWSRSKVKGMLSQQRHSYGKESKKMAGREKSLGISLPAGNLHAARAEAVGMINKAACHLCSSNDWSSIAIIPRITSPTRATKLCQASVDSHPDI